jgi:hypothetical protein
LDKIAMLFGSKEVEELLRPGWEPQFACPYRYFHKLAPGQSWWDLPEQDPAKASQTFVAQPDTAPVPPDVVAARELLAAGAVTAYAIDLWVGSVCLMDAQMRGVAPTAEIRILMNLYHHANGGSYGGFPDVAAFWPDGTISLQELKLHKKDRLGDKQHRAADVLRELIGTRLDLKLVTWGQDFIP